MAATAMIGVATFRCHHRRRHSARPRATSAVRSCTLPPRCRRRGSVTPHPSCAASPPPHGRAAAALSRCIAACGTGFMGPPKSDNGTAALPRSSSSDLRRRLIVPNSTAGAGSASGSSGLLPTILGVAHLLVSLGIVIAADKFLKQAFAAASIKFPSALFGMFCVFSVLVVLDAFVPALAKGFLDFFEPATLFIQRWLPVFYVPSLVVLPLAGRDVPAASGLKIFAIIYLAAVAYGYLSGSGLDAVLGDYYTKVASNPGAGDVLMGFLGSVIISFAFSMFKARKVYYRGAGFEHSIFL
ncbi:hypothetical protein PVAP13_9NG364700 [Panicum virgatum]|uniref:Uncharacterized protein n=1 Tax=Panicum virgatum TaxID=38727 RepID=A0A8T0MSE1_PANVG|nr:hypothetical protein PVAP13_9NG364700 [Panicum virgatum]